MRKYTSNILFRLVCLLFSALLAVLTLLTGIDLTAGSDRISALRDEQRELEEENQRLRAEAACGMSLEELEDYAVRVLGMQRCGSGQIMTIELGNNGD